MAVIRITGFAGMVPLVSARLLADNQAQLAANCKLRSGEVRPYRTPAPAGALAKAGTIRTLSRYADSYWLHWTEDVDVVPAALAEDQFRRIYWTGDGFPKAADLNLVVAGGGEHYPNNHYRLGIPEPLNAPSASVEAPKSGVITAISKQSPAVVTSVGHGLATGDTVLLEGLIGGFAELDGEAATITVVDDDHFSLDGVDATAVEGSYAAGGRWTRYYPPELRRSSAWVYTYVSGWGEEGPPSPASTVIERGDGQPVEITGMDPAPAGPFNIVGKRIYRVNSGTQGAEYQFVAEVPISADSYTDELRDTELGELLPSIDWDPPPAELQGLTALPNGVLAGFVGKTVYLSESFLPHAWPRDYTHTAHYDVVGLGHYGNSLVVLTTAQPYLIQGADPAGMVMTAVGLPQACVSKRGIVSAGELGVLYPSPDGLVLIGASGARLVTEGYLSRDEWQAFRPETILARVVDSEYMAFYDGVDGPGAFLFDLRQGGSGLRLLDLHATAVYVDPVQDALYLVVDGELVRFDAGPEPLRYRYRSKRFALPQSVSLGVARVVAASYQQPLTFRLYADGELRFTHEVKDAELFRLPAGFVGREWEVEIEGVDPLQEIVLAESVGEIAR